MRRFQISTGRSGRTRTVEVRVYSSVVAMRRAARRPWRAWANGEPRDLPNMGALTEPVFVANVDRDGVWDEWPKCALVRFSEDFLDEEVIAHEMTHVGLAIFREDCGEVSGLEEMQSEEKLCYIVGDLTKKTWVKLKDRLGEQERFK